MYRQLNISWQIQVGTSLGATRGLLLRGGSILERFSTVNTIVFDKTGTLTIGKPTVTKVVIQGHQKDANSELSTDFCSLIMLHWSSIVGLCCWLFRWHLIFICPKLKNNERVNFNIIGNFHPGSSTFYLLLANQSRWFFLHLCWEVSMKFKIMLVFVLFTLACYRRGG